jgi:hypothetical protein
MVNKRGTVGAIIIVDELPNDESPIGKKLRHAARSFQHAKGQDGIL